MLSLENAVCKPRSAESAQGRYLATWCKMQSQNCYELHWSSKWSDMNYPLEMHRWTWERSLSLMPTIWGEQLCLALLWIWGQTFLILFGPPKKLLEIQNRNFLFSRPLSKALQEHTPTIQAPGGICTCSRGSRTGMSQAHKLPLRDMPAISISMFALWRTWETRLQVLPRWLNVCPEPSIISTVGLHNTTLG